MRSLPIPPLASPQNTSPAVDPDRFWGTYRPHTYFGLRTREPYPVVTGVAFLDVALIHNRSSNEPVPVRHYCENVAGQRYTRIHVHTPHKTPESKGFLFLSLHCPTIAYLHLHRYGWEVHDGRNLGVHEVVEPGVEVRVEWVKRSSGEWSARIVARPGASSASALAASSTSTPPPLVSLMFYVHSPNELIYEIDIGGDPVAAHGMSVSIIEHFSRIIAVQAAKINLRNHTHYCIRKVCLY